MIGLRHRSLRISIIAHGALQGFQQPYSSVATAPSRHCARQPFSNARTARWRGKEASAQARGRDGQATRSLATVRQHADRRESRPPQQPRESHTLPAPQTSAERSAPEQAWQLTRQVGVSLAAAALAVVLDAAPAPAADTAKVGTCLLASCQKELVLCLADANCAKNLVCLQGCNGRPDETDCQVPHRLNVLPPCLVTL